MTIRHNSRKKGVVESRAKLAGIRPIASRRRPPPQPARIRVNSVIEDLFPQRLKGLPTLATKSANFRLSQISEDTVKCNPWSPGVYFVAGPAKLAQTLQRPKTRPQQDRDHGRVHRLAPDHHGQNLRRLLRRLQKIQNTTARPEMARPLQSTQDGPTRARWPAPPAPEHEALGELGNAVPPLRACCIAHRKKDATMGV